MKWIGDKISYEKHDDFLTIIITGKTESWNGSSWSAEADLITPRFINFELFKLPSRLFC